MKMTRAIPLLSGGTVAMLVMMAAAPALASPGRSGHSRSGGHTRITSILKAGDTTTGVRGSGGSGVVLTRDSSPIDPSEPGIDSRRGTIEADWQRTFIFADGIRLDPFIDARTDVFSLGDLPQINPATPNSSSACCGRWFGR